MTELPGATAIPLHLAVDPWWDLVSGIAYGRVDDGLPANQVLALEEDERIAFVLDRPRRGPVIGFVVRQPDEVDVPALESPEVWDGPRFDVPALALAGAAVGHILLAVRGRFEPGEPTSGAMHFHRAIELADGEHDEKPADPDIVIGQWRLALEAGESKALFGLGYTLVEAGRPQEAYGYLRRYCELTPHNAWAWCWLGRACSALGDVSEARAAFEHAIACESQGSFQTDARDLLAALGSGSDE